MVLWDLIGDSVLSFFIVTETRFAPETIRVKWFQLSTLRSASFEALCLQESEEHCT